MTKGLQSDRQGPSGPRRRRRHRGTPPTVWDPPMAGHHRGTPPTVWDPPMAGHHRGTPPTVWTRRPCGTRRWRVIIAEPRRLCGTRRWRVIIADPRRLCGTRRWRVIIADPRRLCGTRRWRVIIAEPRRLCGTGAPAGHHRGPPPIVSDRRPRRSSSRHTSPLTPSFPTPTRRRARRAAPSPGIRNQPLPQRGRRGDSRIALPTRPRHPLS